MVAQGTRTVDDSAESDRGLAAEFVLAFTIGALIGIGLAVTWVPERRRRRLPARVGHGYRRLREVGATALDDLRRSSREAASEFREELGASLEAAREELGEIARQQLEQARKAMRRERRKPRG
jgi:uncharacterized membrane protein YccC